MSKSDRSALSASHFNDEEAARKHLEAVRWPDGPICPHCGSIDRAYARSRPGLYRCAEPECRKDFTATVGTVFERSKIPLTMWFKATFFVCSSKKGMSALQLSRMLGVTYKTSWFMCHRIREAMKPAKVGPIGGQGRAFESDETVIGGKKKNRAFAKEEPKKHTVLALVDRDGDSHSFHIANVKAKTLREAITKTVDKRSHLMTDELRSYGPIGAKHFEGRHSTVNHSADEYVRLGGFVHVNTAEARFSLMKRAVFGTHHSISEAHLTRYLTEWDFKWNTRKITDGERAAIALKGIEGKRLTYRPADKAANA